MDEKKQFKRAKNMLNSLKIDPLSVLFAEEILDRKLLNKLKNSKYETDRLFYKLVNLIDNKNIFNENKALLGQIMLKNLRLIVPHYIVLMSLSTFAC